MKLCIIQIMTTRKLKCILLGVSLVLAACASTSEQENSETGSDLQRLKAQNALFDHGKQLFLSKQYGPAATALLPLAKQGHTGAQYTIGYMYHYGYGVPRNEKESVRWIATAAARGHPQAKKALARINASHDEHGVLSTPASNP